MKNKAEAISELFLDKTIPIVGLELGTDKSLGGFVFLSCIKKHIDKHIISFNNNMVFNSSDSFEKIVKLLSYNLTYFMRRFDNADEKVGAEKVYNYIKYEFNKIKQNC